MSPLPKEDLEFTFFRSSGPGGQKKNTTDSSVRLRHLPTGIVVLATQSRSQHRNKLLALEELERRLEIRQRRRVPRVDTRPSRAARARRIEEKVQRGVIKRLRRPPEED
jgi:protein subunit release factor B